MRCIIGRHGLWLAVCCCWHSLRGSEHGIASRAKQRIAVPMSLSRRNEEMENPFPWFDLNQASRLAGFEMTGDDGQQSLKTGHFGRRTGELNGALSGSPHLNPALGNISFLARIAVTCSGSPSGTIPAPGQNLRCAPGAVCEPAAVQKFIFSSSQSAAKYPRAEPLR